MQVPAVEQRPIHQAGPARAADPPCADPHTATATAAAATHTTATGITKEVKVERVEKDVKKEKMEMPAREAKEEKEAKVEREAKIVRKTPALPALLGLCWAKFFGSHSVAYKMSLGQKLKLLNEVL